MKHKEIAHEIKHRFHTIDKLAKKSIPKFDEDVVHDFRVEVKKLRAFLRLINTELAKEISFKIPKKLKVFYRHLGAIRSIQLHLQYIADTVPRGKHVIKPYLQLLRNEMNEWKKEAKEVIPGHAEIGKEKSDILDSLPDKLSEDGIKKFVIQKATSINAILVLDNPAEEDMHNLRKELKDIQYTWPYIKEYTDLLPTGLNTHEQVHLLTELLGSYHDKCSSLDFFQPVYINSVTNENGTVALQSIREQLEKEKAELYSAFLNWRSVTLSSAPPSPG